MTNSDITAAYYGVNPVDKIYLGDELVWSSGNSEIPTDLTEEDATI